MKGEYGVLLALIVAVPLLRIGDRNLGLSRNLRRLGAAILLTCIPFWGWDIAATARGHWSFNESYTIGITLLGLPLEEWLFFVIVAYVSIFTWESIKFLLKGRR